MSDEKRIPKGTGGRPPEESVGDGEEYIMAVVRVGDGLLTVCLGCEAFSRSGLRHPFEAPGESTKARYAHLDQVFALWADHLGVTKDTRFGTWN